MITKKNNVSVFSKDVMHGGSYEYTVDKLSCLLANDRITRAFHAVYDVKGKRILDVGCGDGTYTIELGRYGADYVLGVDPSETAVEAATERARQEGLLGRVNFQTGNIYELDLEGQFFDCIILRGVLHHLPDQAKALNSLSVYGDNILIMEPNGTNPVLKIIEKTSKYHVSHEEQSFLFGTLKKWLVNAA